jgi:hypothetical protein
VENKGKPVDLKSEILARRKLFQDAACECIESYFQKKCGIVDAWDVCDRLEGGFDHIASIGCSNNTYQAIMTANINQASLNVFLGQETPEEEIPDILGEFCNTFCGLLMNKEEITRVFGVLLQALPLYSAHCSFFPKATGINGKVFVGESWMYIGYAVRKMA